MLRSEAMHSCPDGLGMRTDSLTVRAQCDAQQPSFDLPKVSIEVRVKHQVNYPGVSTLALGCHAETEHACCQIHALTLCIAFTQGSMQQPLSDVLSTV